MLCYHILACQTELDIAVIVLVLARTLQADGLPDRRPSFDFVGALLSIFGWSSIVLGILLAQQYGFFLAKEPFLLGPWEIAPFGLFFTPLLAGLGFLLVISLLRWERNLEAQDRDGLFRPSLLRIDGVVPGMLVRFLQTGITAAFLYVLPLLLQLSFEFTAMETGGVALVGTVMLVVLSAQVAGGIGASTLFAAEEKDALIASVEDGIQLVSSSVLEQGSQDAGVPDAGVQEIESIYAASRTEAFSAGVALLVLASLLGLAISFWLPKRKLAEVEAAEPSG